MKNFNPLLSTASKHIVIKRNLSPESITNSTYLSYHINIWIFCNEEINNYKLKRIKLSNKPFNKLQWSLIAKNTISKKEQLIRLGAFNYYTNKTLNIECILCKIFTFVDLSSLIQCGYVNVFWMHNTYKPTSIFYVSITTIFW